MFCASSVVSARSDATRASDAASRARSSARSAPSCAASMRSSRAERASGSSSIELYISRRGHRGDLFWAKSAPFTGAGDSLVGMESARLVELPALSDWPISELQFRTLTYETLVLCTHLGTDAVGPDESSLLTQLLLRELQLEPAELSQAVRRLNASGLGESGSSLVEVPAIHRPFLHYRFLLLMAGRPHHFEKFPDFQQWVERQAVTFLCGLLCLTQTVQLSAWEIPGFRLSKGDLQRTLKRSFRECFRLCARRARRGAQRQRGGAAMRRTASRFPCARGGVA